MDGEERARQVAAEIQAALDRTVLPSGVTATVRVPAAADVDLCPICGAWLRTGGLIVEHPLHGRRSISLRSLHTLSHGATVHDTGFCLDGEPVRVAIDVADWAEFLGLGSPAP